MGNRFFAALRMTILLSALYQTVSVVMGLSARLWSGAPSGAAPGMDTAPHLMVLRSLHSPRGVAHLEGGRFQHATFLLVIRVQQGGNRADLIQAGRERPVLPALEI